MGFIERPEGIANFSSAGISLWFKVSEEAITVKTAEYETWSEGDGIEGDLIGVIPLFTFGPNTEEAFFPGTAESGDLSPCVVGILCDDEGAHLYFRAQYATGAPGYEDVIDFNDFFEVGGVVGTGNRAGSGTPQYITVTPEEWHHILIYFDFSDGCSSEYDAGTSLNVVSSCPFFWAFDDVNYTGNYLHPNTASMFGEAAQAAIISNWCLALQPDDPENVFPPSFSFAAGAIPTSSYPFGIPVSSERTDHNKLVRMAEVQVFTEVAALDTSVEENRRAFVTASGRPASPSLAASLMGKSPEIHFQTHNDFVNGNNRGTEGDFDTTGTINPYTPGP